jgi:hypothetical protein
VDHPACAVSQRGGYHIVHAPMESGEQFDLGCGRPGKFHVQLRDFHTIQYQRD